MTITIRITLIPHMFVGLPCHCHFIWCPKQVCEIAEATAVYSMPSYPEDDPEPEEGKGLLFGYTACRRGQQDWGWS